MNRFGIAIVLILASSVAHSSKCNGETHWVGNTRLQKAILSCDIDEVVHLLKEDVSLSVEEYSGKVTPLHIAASVGNVPIIRELIQRGANPSARIQTGLEWTPIIYAIDGENVSALRELIAAGANVNEPTIEGHEYYPIHYAIGARTSAFEMTKALVEAGANISAISVDGTTAVTSAISSSTLEIADYLLDAGATEPSESISLYFAAAWVKGAESLIPKLLAAGVDINGSDDRRKGDTPLHAAVLARNLIFVLELIRYGANPHVRNHEGTTPMELARKYDLREYIAALNFGSRAIKFTK